MITTFFDLSEREKEFARSNGIVNGIGAEDTKYITYILQKLQPKWLSNASGEYHDWKYCVGGDEVDRYNADLHFYLLILQDARQNTPLQIIFLFRLWRAIFYYICVRMFGYKRFYYGRKRTKKEIFALLKKNCIHNKISI